MTSRRELLCAAAAIAATPRWVAAQAKPIRIGWISYDGAASASVFYDAFRDGLRRLGYEEGRNLVLDARWGDSSDERLKEIAPDIARTSNIIVAHGGQAIRAARAAAGTTPIVVAASGDPVEAGLAESLARPGRNLTGVTLLSLELVGKRMELLKEALPALKRVAIVANPQHAGLNSELNASQSAAKPLGLAVDYFPARNINELEDAFTGMVKARSEAFVVFPDSVLVGLSDRFAQFALKNRLPAISGWPQFAERGNLMTYGPNLRDSFRRIAVYVDKIAKGAKPADMPIERPTTVELVVNMKTAKSIGVVIPQTILLRADKIIE